MKKIAPKILKYVFIILIILAIIIVLIPFDLFDMEQAQRIAKWKSVYEQLNYSFSLVKLHEGSIIPTEIKNDSYNNDYIVKYISPYMNLESNEYINSKYKYRKMNGHSLAKTSQFIFDKFLKRKDGVFISIRKNELKTNNNYNPLYLMFVDINGNEKPNRIGKDIFFISIYKDKISALGKNKELSALKASCSPIGGGFYCSEYYLLGGQF